MLHSKFGLGSPTHQLAFIPNVSKILFRIRFMGLVMDRLAFIFRGKIRKTFVIFITHSLTHSLTHSITHSLTHSPFLLFHDHRGRAMFLSFNSLFPSLSLCFCLSFRLSASASPFQSLFMSFSLPLSVSPFLALFLPPLNFSFSFCFYFFLFFLAFSPCFSPSLSRFPSSRGRKGGDH